MSRAARSMQIWSLYLFILGSTLVVAPNPLLGIFGISPTQEVWIRVVGMLLLFLGLLDYLAANRELRFVFEWATAVRYSVLLFFGSFVLLDLAPSRPWNGAPRGLRCCW